MKPHAPVSPTPPPDASCRCCAAPLALEMERDEALCLECQKLLHQVAHV
jgi:hypothetical protein